MDWLATVFLGAFLVGLLFTVGVVILGLTHVGLHDLGGHFGGHHVHLPGPSGHGTSESQVSPWNLTALTAFVAWFGGVGYLALVDWRLAVLTSLLVALVAGLVGWAIIYLFLSRVLPRGETRMDPADYRMEGMVARVTVPIGSERIGEIQYTMGGTRRSEGARSLDGSPIPRDAEVVIVRYERGLAYVQPWNAFVEEERVQARPGG